MEDQIKNDLKQAQLNRDELKVGTLRMVLSEIRYAQIAKGDSFGDTDLITVLQREVKKRRESAESFRAGNRPELASKEDKEVEIIAAYLPTQLTDDELTKIVDQEINQTGATSLAQMGQIIGRVMSAASGRADGGRVSNLVRQRLSQ